MGEDSFSGYALRAELPALRSELRRFSAVQENLGREVEIRVLAAPIAEGGNAHLRFREECRALATLEHPAVIKVLDVGVTGGRVFYVTDLRRARSLAALLADEGGALPSSRAFKMALEIADGLVHLHQHRLLMRRLDPDAIFLNLETDHFYLGDYSLLKKLGGPSMTEAGVGQFEGLPGLPEGRALADLDARSDLFLFGAVLYQSFTGHDPRPELTAGIRSKEEPPLLPASAQRPELPAALDAVLARALSFAPEKRPATAAEMLELLSKAREGLRVREAVDSSLASGMRAATPPPPRPKGTRRTAAGGEPDTTSAVRRSIRPGILGGVIALAVIGYGLVGPRKAPEAAPTTVQPRQSPQPGAARAAAPTQEDFARLAQEAESAPTSSENFLRRWNVAHRYLSELPRQPRAAAEDPVAKLLALRFQYFREPAAACKALDRVIASGAMPAGRGP
ncbi:MAG: serine/threonine protein kinase [Candidatus Wallbacteria bacterium]|nr:serine/threonine protein kinase [Candidatus Wallbacteria bacterium]